MPGTSHFNPPGLPPPTGFSHASAGAGTVVYIAGQVGSDETGTILFPGDIAGQFGLAIRNFGIALESAGCLPDDVVKMTYFVTDIAAYRAVLKPIGKHYQAVLGRNFPASTLVEVKALFDPDAMVEIEGVAVHT